MDMISYQCLQGHKHVINHCQTNGHNQPSMSTWTQEHNKSMPNQWAPSAINVYRDTSMQLSMPNRWAWSAINVYTDTSTKLINSRKIGKISYQCLLRHKHLIDQCQTNGHNLQLICLEQGHDYSLTAIKAESLYQLSIFLDVKVKF